MKKKDKNKKKLKIQILNILEQKKNTYNKNSALSGLSRALNILKILSSFNNFFGSNIFIFQYEKYNFNEIKMNQQILKMKIK